MTKNDPDELDLAAVREAYHSWPTDSSSSPARTVPAASRNRRRHWLVASGAATAAIAIIGVGGHMINQNGHRGASPSAEPPGAAKDTPGTTGSSATPSSETPTSAIARQERLDALADQLRVTATTDRGYGYNLVAIDIASYGVTLWRATPNPQATKHYGHLPTHTGSPFTFARQSSPGNTSLASPVSSERRTIDGVRRVSRS